MPMTLSTLSEALGLPSLLAWLLVLCRVGPLVALCPFVGWGMRLFLALLFSGVFAALLPATATLSWLLAPRELVIGGGLSLFALLPWAVLRGVGQLIDATLLTGGPAGSDERTGAAARLLGLLAIASLALVPLALSLATSYQLVPLAGRTALLPSALSALGTKLVFYTLLVGLPLAGARLGVELVGAVVGRLWLGERAAFTRLAGLASLLVVVVFSTALITAALALSARAPGEGVSGLRSSVAAGL